MIGFIVLALIGLYSLGSALGRSNFSETHISFSFLNFPVFIGEILMGVCIVLWVVQYWRQGTVLTKWHKIFLIYWNLILLKALWDFWIWGPLAFRHAALFYYPIFVFIGYCFYKKEYFSGWFINGMILPMVFLVSKFTHIDYFLYSGFALAIVLIMHVRTLMWKALFIGILLVFGHFSELFGQSRTNLIGTLTGLTFLGTIFITHFLKFSCKVKGLIGFSVLLTVLMGAAFFADRSAILSCLKVGNLYQNYSNAVSYIDQKRKFYTQQPLVAAIYHGNKDKSQWDLATQVEGEHGYSDPIQSFDPIGSKARLFSAGQNNAVFRLIIWRDMVKELIENKSLLGVGFGKPQRSSSLEILGWGVGEWCRDGWVTPHNGYIHMIYRLGIIGVLLIMAMMSVVIYMTKIFIRLRSKDGIILVSVFIYWMMASNFLVILELPHYAIPFWTLFGMVWAYGHALTQRNVG